MSIKDLFNQKTVIFKSAESASIDAESIDQMIHKAEELDTFLPAIDFATASSFVKFGSAKEYYLRSISAFTRITLMMVLNLRRFNLLYLLAI